MANAATIIEIIHEDGINPAALGNELVLDTNNSHEGIRAISDYLQSIAGGVNGANVRVRVDSSSSGAVSTGVCTINSDTYAIVSNDTEVIGSVTFTWETSADAEVETEVTLSAVDATAATNLAAAINAHSALVGVVSATSALGVVTVTLDQDHRVGRHIGTSRTETNAGSVTWTNAVLTTAATLASVADGVTYTAGA